MNRRLAAVSLFFLMVACVASTQGCSAGNGPGSGTDRICTPGNYVFCRCADRSEGTKLCKDDGASFEPCALGDTTPCPGGEIPVDDAGNPVDPPVEDADAGSDVVTEGGGSTLESCPGKALSVDGVNPTVVHGDTTGAADDFSGKPGACAVGASTPDHVYALIPTATGHLNIKLEGLAPYDPTLYVRTDCAVSTTQISCAETTGGGGTESTTIDVVTGRTYYIIVDGKAGSVGQYSLTLTLTPGSFCGDGVVKSGEACDDGNKVEDDGCSNDCQHPNGNPASGNSCPGQPVDVWGTAAVKGTGSTVGNANTFAKPGTGCAASGSNSEPDHIYAVTVHSSGTLYVQATPAATFNVMVSARTACTDSSTMGAGMCVNDSAAGVDEIIAFAVTSGQTYYVAVDGGYSGGPAGTYTVSFQMP